MIRGSIIGRVANDTSIYNAVNSVNNLVCHTVPELVALILEDASPEFGTRFLRKVFEFFERLVTVVALCVGRIHLGTFVSEILTNALREENRECLNIR